MTTELPNPLEDLECRCGTQRRLTKADVLVCPHCDTPSHEDNQALSSYCPKCRLRERRTR